MILIIIIGIIAGFFAGALGFSAGPILVPLLLLFSLSATYKSAVGTTILTIIPPLSIFAALNYYRHGHVNVKLAIILMICVTIGAYFGSVFTLSTSSNVMAYLTSAILAILSVFWFYVGKTGKFIDPRDISVL
jgi:uncharacterized protein